MKINARTTKTLSSEGKRTSKLTCEIFVCNALMQHAWHKHLGTVWLLVRVVHILSIQSLVMQVLVMQVLVM